MALKTQRSVENFKIGKERMAREVIHAYAILKRELFELANSGCILE